ncbi:hypothetical protein GN958_ATG05898 [Phytophthora infestans]|uniref:DNA helicase n=1 Tax=Phytophthora infestans TaxID=4787 RepID=A0A8S9V0G0_PHYIN|nr:hypothetical protein GN958_ATG06808 [Phytophthora infestans]KAF4144914.1 hypothetical protein GN958_ATG05898 [Phytophthora infestans]
MDSSLREIIGNPTNCFGGIHVLLVGDWLQQLPVAGQPAFITADEVIQLRRRHSTDYLDRVRRINAYRSHNSVVILTENMRHRRDPVWRDISTSGELEISKMLTLTTIGTKSNCPIIVTSNALRAEFNMSSLRVFCKKAGVVLHRFPGAVSRPRHRLTSPQRKSLESIRDDKTGGMPIVLEIAINLIVQCTKNMSPLLKLANGSIGTVVGFTMPQNDEVRIHTSDTIEEHQHKLPPDIVFVELKDYSNHTFLPGLPPGVVPVCRRIEKGIEVKLPGREFSIAIDQVPLVAAYSLIAEKCQGLTVDKMILAPLKHTTRRTPQPFVVLRSRPEAMEL